MVRKPLIARRMADIRPFYVMDLLARARRLEAAGRSIIHMEVGEPDFPTPGPIVEAGRQALTDGHTRYTPACGLPELRQAICDYYREQFGVALSPERVVVTPGSSGALQLVMSVLINPGEQVLLPDPGYPCNRHFVLLAGGEPKALNVGSATGYQPEPAAVERAWGEKTRALMVASPSNPTGTLLERGEMAALQQTVKRCGGILLVDEIYQGLVYEGERFSALELDDELVVVNSFSKYFGMTGWRLGWVIAPPEMVEAMDRLAQNIFLSAPTPAQHAALAAFTPECQRILQQRRDAFARRRDYLLPALEGLGFRFSAPPRGAFYLYADSSGVTDDSFLFAQQLLEQAGVAVTPGRDFGDHRPASHLRFAYTREVATLQEGVERIRAFLERGPAPP